MSLKKKKKLKTQCCRLCYVATTDSIIILVPFTLPTLKSTEPQEC